MMAAEIVTVSQLQVNRPEDIKLFQEAIAHYCQTWSTLPNSSEPDWEKVFALYAPVGGLMFLDAVTPHSFSTADEMKAVFPAVAKLTLVPHTDLKVYRLSESKPKT